jgi:hypothetical protein
LRRRLSRKTSAWLVALVLLALAALLRSDTPAVDHWWQPAKGQNVGQDVALGHWWVHEHQAPVPCCQLQPLLAHTCWRSRYVNHSDTNHGHSPTL